MKWEQAKKVACADETLRLLTVSILNANKSGNPDRLAYRVWRDRCEELCIVVPNAAYWSILMGVVAGKVK